MAKRKKKNIKVVNKIAYILITIGAINWGLDKVFDFNIVDTLLGSFPAMVTWVYGLVGLAGVYAVYLLLTKQLK